MTPGEIIPKKADPIIINDGLETVILVVANTGDRPVQILSLIHI